MFDQDKIIKEIEGFGTIVDQFEPSLINKLKKLLRRIADDCSCGCHGNYAAIVDTHCDRCVRIVAQSVRDELIVVISNFASAVNNLLMSVFLESRLKHLQCGKEEEHELDDCALCKLIERLEDMRAEMNEKAFDQVADFYDVNVKL